MDAPGTLPLGSPLPEGDPHAVSVCLPTWADTFGWATREPRILDALVTGYPRFFMPRIVGALGKELCKRFYDGIGVQSESKCAMPVASRRHAILYRQFVRDRRYLEPHQPASPGCVDILRVKWGGQISRLEEDEAKSVKTGHFGLPGREDIYLVCCPIELFDLAKAFWQHTGFGITSRKAELWLEHAPFLGGVSTEQSTRPKALDPVLLGSRADFARAQMKSRISAGRIAKENSVFLYASGMSAITEAAIAIQEYWKLRHGPVGVAAVFGFVYVDTYKVLSLVLGYEATLYKYAESEIDALERQLESGLRLNACFTEFPGNPLLQTPNLPRLHALSKKYGFMLVVDDTIGTYGNVELLPSCDVLCTSLTKMFSGACNVMGGSVVVSPESPFHDTVTESLRGRYEDHVWFPEDVLVMEHNSRDFISRVRRASANALAVVELLKRHPSVAEVYYPKGSPTQDLYDQVKLPEGGYGFLVSVRLVSPAKAIKFYDALDTAKGPSLGTNFTLTCAYTLLAHYRELEWAASFGVVEDLVRISVGLEEREWLQQRVDKALRATVDC